MANVQTITPSVGQGVIFTAQGSGLTPGYSAIDLRRAMLAGGQEGVLPTDANAGTGWECVQREAGPNSQVQINANLSCARVQGDTVTAQGLYTIAPHSAVVLLDITAAHATLPRIDQVILEVLDNVHDASGSSLARLRILDGTPTSGATLDNRLGVAALPSNAIRLCDFLVPLNASGTVSLDNAEIRDRRPWARGADYRTIRSSADYTTTSLSLAVVDSTNLNPRIECSGAPIEVLVTSNVTGSASARIDAEVRIDGVSQSQIRRFQVASGSYVSVVLRLDATPSAGSHLFAPYWATSAGTATLEASSGVQLAMRVREIVAQDARNNPTTTG